MLIEKKCLNNRDDITIALNHLNFLLGKNKDVMQSCIGKLFSEFPKAFGVLEILIAVRDSKEEVLDINDNPCKLKDYVKLHLKSK
ncbi:hypothetical protein BBW65_06960 [Helicobacter enhydrae]|uniref:Restriction endonuclease type II DpnII-like domain-containing protein n=1 Tax=Helicobacter enhydrae TaxID=222136 RepID=A0A1B1U705_9HELI|nr:hypothetical protein BBW65_06960 [Helicobacter enhydrae]